MARKSKPSKGSTKQSDETDQASTEIPEAAAEDVEPSESVEPKASATDIEDAEVLEDLSATEIADDDTMASESTEDTEAEQPEDASDIDSPDVPGVIPAQVSAPPPPPIVDATATVSSGPGALSMVFGGLLAGAIGFLVATFAVPEGWPNAAAPEEDKGLETTVAAQSERIDTLASQIADIPDPDPAPDLGPLAEQIAGLEGQVAKATAAIDERIGGLADQLGDYESRIADLEARPIVEVDGAGSEEVQTQLDTFRQQLEDATADAEARIAAAQEEASRVAATAERITAEANAEAERVEAEAAAEAERVAAGANRVATVATIRAALEDGTPFNETLAQIEDAPEALVAVADKGVPTLPTLQADFADAARVAISTAQTVPENASATDRFAAFLKRQTNARSLAPRDGDDADAVLSRAEAALTGGDLGTALTEMSVLPEAAKDAMASWTAAAEMRAAALDAAETLAISTN